MVKPNTKYTGMEKLRFVPQLEAIISSECNQPQSKRRPIEPEWMLSQHGPNSETSSHQLDLSARTAAYRARDRENRKRTGHVPPQVCPGATAIQEPIGYPKRNRLLLGYRQERHIDTRHQQNHRFGYANRKPPDFSASARRHAENKNSGSDRNLRSLKRCGNRPSFKVSNPRIE